MEVGKMATIDAAPKRVAAAAFARGLGPLVMATNLGNPFTGFLTLLAVPMLAFGALVAINSLASLSATLASLLALLRPLLIFLLAISLLFVFGSFVLLLHGFQRYYLYAGGVVHWQNGRVRVLTWPEIAEIRCIHGFFSMRTGYKLIPAGRGRPLEIAAVEGEKDGNEMGRRLEELARGAGVPVI
jgi:hypothetical protein